MHHGCRAAVSDSSGRVRAALDAKVLVRAARVVGGRENEAAVCLATVAVADHRRHRRRGQQAAHAHPHLRGQRRRYKNNSAGRVYHTRSSQTLRWLC